jgi:O-antigen/teichoic acid export membrane protein
LSLGCRSLSGQSVVTTSERAKNVVSGVRLLTVQNIVNSVLSSVFLALLLRLLSPSDYGLYSALVLVTTIGTSIASFGLQTAATRFVAYLTHNEGEVRAVSRLILILSFAFASVSALVLALISPTLSLYFTRSTSSSWIFALSGGWLFSSTVAGTFQGVVQGMKKYEAIAKILMAAGTVMVCLTVLGLLEFSNVIIPILAWVVYGGAICFWSLSIIRKSSEKVLAERTNSQTVRQVLRYSLPLAVAGIVTVATGVADPMVVGGMLSESQLGAYNAAIAISGGLGVIFFAPLNTAFFPETSSHAENLQKISNGLRLALRYSILALIPASFALAALSTQMMNLFTGGDSSYLVANPSLQMMSIFFIFVALQGIPTSLLLSTGKTTQAMIIGIATVILDVALSVLMVPSFGLLGAATSRVLVDVAGFLMALYLTKKYFKNVVDLGFYSKVLLMSLVMFVVLSMLSGFVSDSFYTLIPYILVGSLVLVLCVRGLHVLTPEDKNYLEHFVPAKMTRLVHFILFD